MPETVICPRWAIACITVSGNYLQHPDWPSVFLRQFTGIRDSNLLYVAKYLTNDNRTLN